MQASWLLMPMPWGMVTAVPFTFTARWACTWYVSRSLASHGMSSIGSFDVADVWATNAVPAAGLPDDVLADEVDAAVVVELLWLTTTTMRAISTIRPMPRGRRTRRQRSCRA